MTILLVIFVLVFTVGLFCVFYLRTKSRRAKINEVEEELVALKKRLNTTSSDIQLVIEAASHDMKTPLRAISQLSAILSEDLKGTADEDVRMQLELIGERAKHSYKMVDGLLEYLSIIHKPIEKKLVDMNIVVKNVIENVPVKPNVEVLIKNQLPSVVMNERHAELVFSHLIGNSIKFNDKEKGLITVEVATGKDEHQFIVEDNGIGIQENNVPKLFSLFKKLESRGNEEGLGMGLALVKKIVESNGGRINISSKRMVYTKVSFTLPKK